MTEDDLKAIEARANAATQGPWTPMIGMTITDPHADPVVCRVAIELQVWSASETGQPSNDVRIANTKFIASARTDVPKLVAEVRRQAAELQAWRDWVADMFGARLDTDDPDTPNTDEALRSLASAIINE